MGVTVKWIDGVKKYEMPNGKTVAFEYDAFGIGKITVEAMDSLMEMIGAKEIDDNKGDANDKRYNKNPNEDG